MPLLLSRPTKYSTIGNDSIVNIHTPPIFLQGVCLFTSFSFFVGKGISAVYIIYTYSFGGIEIASGAVVEMEDNRVFSNQNLINKLIDSGDCLYKLTSYKYYPIQSFYRCITCNSSGTVCILFWQKLFATHMKMTMFRADCNL